MEDSTFGKMLMLQHILNSGFSLSSNHKKKKNPHSHPHPLPAQANMFYHPCIRGSPFYSGQSILIIYVLYYYLLPNPFLISNSHSKYPSPKLGLFIIHLRMWHPIDYSNIQTISIIKEN